MSTTATLPQQSTTESERDDFKNTAQPAIHREAKPETEGKATIQAPEVISFVTTGKVDGRVVVRASSIERKMFLRKLRSLL